MVEIALKSLVNTAPNLPFQEVVQVKNRHLKELMSLGGIQGIRLATTTDGEHVIEIYARTATLGRLPQALEGVSVRPVVIDKVLY